MKNSGSNKSTESASAFVIVPFSTIDDAQCFAADVKTLTDGAIVTRGSRKAWSEEDRAGSELTLEGWRVKIADSHGTVVMTDRLA